MVLRIFRGFCAPEDVRGVIELGGPFRLAAVAASVVGSHFEKSGWRKCLMVLSAVQSRVERMGVEGSRKKTKS